MSLPRILNYNLKIYKQPLKYSNNFQLLIKYLFYFQVSQLRTINQASNPFIPAAYVSCNKLTKRKRVPAQQYQSLDRIECHQRFFTCPQCFQWATTLPPLKLSQITHKNKCARLRNTVSCPMCYVHWSLRSTRFAFCN